MPRSISAVLSAALIGISATHAQSEDRVNWRTVEAAITDVIINDAPCSDSLHALGVCLPDPAPRREVFACTGDPLETLEAAHSAAPAIRVEAAQSVRLALDGVASQSEPADIEALIHAAYDRDQAIRQWRPNPWSPVANGVKWTYACAHSAYGAELVRHAIDALPISALEENPVLADQIWLLSQHVDHDPDFQERMANYFRQSELDHMRGHAAFLTDRYRQGRGQPQIYGTQFMCLEGQLRPFNLMDADSVDERRLANGLGPIAEALDGRAFSACGG